MEEKEKEMWLRVWTWKSTAPLSVFIVGQAIGIAEIGRTKNTWTTGGLDFASFAFPSKNSRKTPNPKSALSGAASDLLPPSALPG